MKQNLAHISLLVKDYDEALAFYVGKLNFICVEDSILPDSKRWVLIKPAGADSNSCQILLAKAVGEHQLSFVGNQSGGRVFLFLYTDDFASDYKNLIEQNVRIVRTPTIESYGTVAVFEDLYGNLWDLIEPKN
jgi:catechol 2,3-dioxygenase-like lactoylglutathione lyase family enzyme